MSTESESQTADAAEAQHMAAEELAQARQLQQEWIAELSAVDQSEIRDIQDELATHKFEIDFVPKWWGFELHLNSEAAQLVATITEEIGKIVAKYPKAKPFAPLIKAAAKIRAQTIKAADKGYGVKLVSPWMAPLMLIPLPLGPKKDTKLWWTVFETGQGWADSERFEGDNYTAANPSLAKYNDDLICLHRGSNNATLWKITYDPEDGWGPSVAVSQILLTDGPAAASYKGKLHSVHRGNGEAQLWHATFDGSGWRNVQISGALSKDTPALAVYNDRLYCFALGNGDNSLWWMYYDGSRWSTYTKVPQVGAGSGPGLAAYGGKLHCVFRGNNEAQLWHLRFDGTTATNNVRISGAYASDSPALAVFDGALYLVSRGNNDQNLWWSRFETSWSTYTRLPKSESGQGPALIAYRDPNGTQTQLLCLHKGRG